MNWLAAVRIATESLLPLKTFSSVALSIFFYHLQKTENCADNTALNNLTEKNVSATYNAKIPVSTVRTRESARGSLIIARYV